MNPARLTLDNPAFSGRLRHIHRSSAYVRRPSEYRSTHVIQDIAPATTKLVRTASKPMQSVTAAPAQPHHAVLPAARLHAQPKASPLYHREAVSRQSHRQKARSKSRGKQPIVLYTMATILFAVGLAVSFNGWHANHQVSAQVSQLSQKANQAGSSSGGVVPPSTTKPTQTAVTSYAVAPDLPRYIKIPKIGVDARVLRVGVTSSGAIGTPGNVFDTGWYTGSAKPGEPGATLIDGHVSSWTTNGVFYNIKKLVAGDTISIERGDGKVLNYKVVKSQVYDADNVDMAAALTPVDPAKSGLNLITCTGKVKPGTSEFTSRIVVFAEQV